MCHQVDCGCQQHSPHAPLHGWHHYGGCCCGIGYAPRRFPTKEEIIKEMEEYLKQLRAEAKGVEEGITELRKEAEGEAK